MPVHNVLLIFAHKYTVRLAQDIFMHYMIENVDSIFHILMHMIEYLYTVDTYMFYTPRCDGFRK